MLKSTLICEKLVLLVPSPRTSELEYPSPLGGAVVVGVSAARAVGEVRVVAAGDGSVDPDADGGGEGTELVPRESAVGVEDRDEEGESIADGRIVALPVGSGVVTIRIVVEWGDCALSCVVSL